MQAEETPLHEQDQRNWLNRLQQDSWQLELVISGILIFLLLGAYGPIEDLSRPLSMRVVTGGDVFGLAAVMYSILKISYYALVVVLLIHLLLRGFWIGAIGLRSVSGEFDFTVLDFQPRFTNWLKKRLGTFDEYIQRLEGQCSVAFSMAFLLFFSIVSLGIFTAFVVAVVLALSAFLGWLSASEFVINVTISLVSTAILLFGLLYLIDFSSLGWLKKRKWLQGIYFPFYRFMGWITLARFYRPFYYNLIDHPFGRRLVKGLWIVVLLGMLLSSISILNFPYFPTAANGANVRNASYYLEGMPPAELPILQPSVNRRYAKDDYLEVFVPYLPRQTDEALQQLYPDLMPVRTRSYAIDGPIYLVRSLNPDANTDSLLLAHASLLRLYRNDSLLTDPGWQFYDHPDRNQPGLSCDLPVYDLPRGQHELRIERREIRGNDSISWYIDARIVFVR